MSSWMTGIQEVPLPMAYKLRNIEDTEAAKKRLLASSAAATSQCAQLVGVGVNPFALCAKGSIGRGRFTASAFRGHVCDTESRGRCGMEQV